MWLDPARTGQHLVWRLPWPPDIVDDLILSTNPHGKITNSDLELAALVLQEATLLEAVPKASMGGPKLRFRQYSNCLLEHARGLHD